jgi:hypothetical protein
MRELLAALVTGPQGRKLLRIGWHVEATQRLGEILGLLKDLLVRRSHEIELRKRDLRDWKRCRATGGAACGFGCSIDGLGSFEQSTEFF